MNNHSLTRYTGTRRTNTRLIRKVSIGKNKEFEFSDAETAYLAGNMFGAGSDTTASALSIGVLAAACYPKAQAKVQEELYAVVGHDEVCVSSVAGFFR